MQVGSLISNVEDDRVSGLLDLSTDWCLEISGGIEVRPFGDEVKVLVLTVACGFQISCRGTPLALRPAGDEEDGPSSR
jgi:hypothetical protein